MSRPTPFRRTGFPHSKKAGIAATIAALAVTGLGATPAQSAAEGDCPAAFPVDDLTADQPVTGRTVSKGTTPDGFTGKVLGVLDDGIGLDLDMIMVKLDSPAIADAGGIWAGMSGSPVYAENGELIGAVAYGLSYGPTPYAGVTPAAAMQEMLTEPPGTGVQMARKVAVPASMQRRMIRSGATRAEAGSEFRQLRIPMSLSASIKGGERRQSKIYDRFKIANTKVVPGGARAPGDPVDPSGIVPGGNIAGSLSYGDVTYSGLGTTTAVCGSEVLAFGHPFLLSGPSTLTMHTADALYIQPDPAYSPFKVANLTGAAGGFDLDGPAGIKGTTGAAPETTPITSQYAVGENARTGETQVSVLDYFGDIALAHVVSNIDTLYGGYGKGSGSFGFTIEGEREDGTPFSFTREDAYADMNDISFATAFDLYQVLSKLQYDTGEDITFTSLDSTADLTKEYAAYQMTRLEVRANGDWSKVNRRRGLAVTPGSTQKFRVMLTSEQLGDKVVPISVPIPERSRNRGYLQIYGGNTGGGGEGAFLFRRAAGDSKFDKVLTKLEQAPKNDDVVATLVMAKGERKGTVQKQSVGDVVDGFFSLSLRTKG